MKQLQVKLPKYLSMPKVQEGIEMKIREKILVPMLILFVTAIANGSQIASNTATAMETMFEHSCGIGERIVDIAKASQVQSDSIKQVSSNVDTISGVVQQTSVIAEESAESSEHLASQADLLQVLTKQFKLS
jgi:methyl-accepting chemotaxis protein